MLISIQKGPFEAINRKQTQAHRIHVFSILTYIRWFWWPHLFRGNGLVNIPIPWILWEQQVTNKPRLKPLERCHCILSIQALAIGKLCCSKNDHPRTRISHVWFSWKVATRPSRERSFTYPPTRKRLNGTFESMMIFPNFRSWDMFIPWRVYLKGNWSYSRGLFLPVFLWGFFYLG